MNTYSIKRALPRLFLCLLFVAAGAMAQSGHDIDSDWAQLPDGMSWDGSTTWVAADGKGQVMVMVRTAPYFRLFTRDGAFVESWDEAEDAFGNAHSVTYDSEGNVWATDAANHVVYKYSPAGERLMTLGREGMAGDNESRELFNQPNHVAVAPNGDIYVSDGYVNARVVHFTAQGSFVRIIGGVQGGGPGELDVPHGVGVDSRGRILVNDSANERISVFDADGGFLESWPYPSRGGIAVTPDDTVYVSDVNAGVVNILQDGELIDTIAVDARPHGLAVDGDGAIYVSDSLNRKVMKITSRRAPAQAGAGGAREARLPARPTPVPLARISGPVTGPGDMYASVQSLPPTRGLDHYGYEAVEYFVSGTAAGQPWHTRMVVRRPANDEDFSGLVFAEAMHPSGSTHIFEFTSDYSMSAGHASVEVVTGGLELLTGHNSARYEDIRVAGDQVSAILAQVGAMLREGEDSPFAESGIRRMVLAGTSATAAVLIRYLPGHEVWRTPGMERIYDGFMPHSNGSNIAPVDVPLIQVPTMTEVHNGAAPTRQDGDEPGNQYRLYEFAGMGHVDSRYNVRLQPNPCAEPSSSFPLQAYLSVAMDHLLRWVDEGVTPPRAPRLLMDRNSADGSLMALDHNGNPIGGIRNPYLDVATARHGVPNRPAEPLIDSPSDYVAAGGLPAARIMCRLSAYAVPFSAARLRELYGTPENYRRQVQAELDEMEAAGWSLPVYREMILEDAGAVDF